MSSKYSEGVYVNQDLILAVESMEVRWIMIIEKHLDDDPIKAGDLRYAPPFSSGLGKDLQVLDWLFEGRVNLDKDQPDRSILVLLTNLF